MIYDKNVKVISGVEKYITRAEELGYSLSFNQYNLNMDRWLVLYPKNQHRCKKYSIISGWNPMYEIISQEEFFGEKMLKLIEKDVLEVLVDLVCDTLTSFSAYDVTVLLRSRLPAVNILHDEVRNIVERYASNNNLKSNFDPTGTFRIFSKNVAQNNIVSGSKATKLHRLLTQKATVNTSKTTVEELSLQTENRVNLTSILRKHFPKTGIMYLTRDNGNLVLSTSGDGERIFLGSEVRLRTGFNNRSGVRVVVSNDKVVVSPK